MFVLYNALRLLHPAMPFVTEEIWQHLPTGDEAPALMVADWPDAGALAAFVDEDAEAGMGLTVELVSAIRQLRARYGISPKQALRVAVRLPGAEADALNSQAPLVTSLANLEHLEIAEHVAKMDGSVSSVVGSGEMHVALEGIVDLDAERARLDKQAAELAADLAKLDKKLSNPGFLAKAAPEVVAKDQARRDETAERLQLVRSQMESLG